MRTYKEDRTFSGMTGPAVVVKPDTPWSFIFWRGAQYVGCIDLGGEVWFNPEWLETNSPEDLHCYEPIMDKQCKYSRADIIEAGEARARVRWHYACCNIKYEVFRGNTEADEYYTVYPDGVSVRELVAWPGNQNSFGGNSRFWQVLEFILMNGTGTRPDDVVDREKAFVFMNEGGEKLSFAWPLPYKDLTPLCKVHPEVIGWKTYIGKVNLRDRPSPFVAFMKDRQFFPYDPCNYCNQDHPAFHLFFSNAVWKHWPANPMENFVLAVEAEEEIWGKMPTHTSFLDCNITGIPGNVPVRPSSYLFLVGATQDPDDGKVIELVKSWTTPAGIETGYESKRLPWGLSHGPILYEGYRHDQRAYVFRLIGARELRFKMKPIVKVINPVVRVENWSDSEPKVIVQGDDLPSDSYRWQFDGSTLTVWMKGEFTKETEFRIA